MSFDKSDEKDDEEEDDRRAVRVLVEGNIQNSGHHTCGEVVVHIAVLQLEREFHAG